MNATTLVSILRGSTTTADGDTIDAPTVVTQDIPAMLIELGSNTTTEASRVPRTVRTHRLTLPLGTDLRASDRILDQISGERFLVDSVTAPRVLPSMGYVRAYLRKTT